MWPYVADPNELSDEKLKEASDEVLKKAGTSSTPMERFWLQVWLDYNKVFSYRVWQKSVKGLPYGPFQPWRIYSSSFNAGKKFGTITVYTYDNN